MNLEKIKETIKKLLSFFGVEEPEINIEEKENSCRINLRVSDAGILIGKDGETLICLEQILKGMINKMEGAKSVNIVLDINNYRLQRETAIRELAQKAGRQVMLTKKEIYLPAMNSYERRLVHLELSINPEVITESVGQEPERRIVIKPAEFSR